MDRQMVYPGAIPLETDILNCQRNAMIAVGWAIRASLGAGTYVDGFTCTPTSPASQSVIVTPGQILTLGNVDNSAYSSLAADTTQQIIKQGLMLTNATFTCAAPSTIGYSVNYLIEVAQADVDANPVVLPYYNPSNPLVAWSGPAGAGTTNNTVRQSQATVQIKAGTPATTGTQTTPSTDAGFVALFVVSVAYGQTTISSGNIAQPTNAPFVTKLPAIPAAVQDQLWTAFGDTSASANTVVIAPIPALSAYAIYQTFSVKIANTNTGPSVFNAGQGNAAIVSNSGQALIGGELIANRIVQLTFDGTSWQLDAMVASSAIAVVNAEKTIVPYAAGTWSWTCPAGITRVRVFGRGSGGGGGGTAATATYAAGGGGGGAYFLGIFTVVPGTAYAIVVGAGGAKGTSGNNGSNGNATSFGSFASAPGGNAGEVGDSASPQGLGGGGASIATGGQTNWAGGPGSAGQSVGGAGEGGSGGGSYGQGACNLPAIGSGAGINGLFPGMGGNGAGGATQPGGAGGDGELVLDY